jgi:hypothetical protein
VHAQREALQAQRQLKQVSAQVGTQRRRCTFHVVFDNADCVYERAHPLSCVASALVTLTPFGAAPAQAALCTGEVHCAVTVVVHSVAHSAVLWHQRQWG